MVTRDTPYLKIALCNSRVKMKFFLHLEIDIYSMKSMATDTYPTLGGNGNIYLLFNAFVA